VPELPEVETVRRMLEKNVLGRTIRRVLVSGKNLRLPIARTLPARLRGRTIHGLRRHGKYLLIDLDQEISLLSHLGMSGRWLFRTRNGSDDLAHVHVDLRFRDGSELRFQDPRRFGLLKIVRSGDAFRDPLLALLGPDPVLTPPKGEWIAERARGMTIAVKNFLLDQRRIAGIGNIYASEILHRARVDPRRQAGRVTPDQWQAIAVEIPIVLRAAIERMGTTFSSYRTIWNEPGAYGEQLLVYDRAGEPCRACGRAIRRIVQGQRSTFFCPSCQAIRKGRSPGRR
jgi:formamidopyrimidine-DNA glycosylase